MPGRHDAALDWSLGYDPGTKGAATLLDRAGVFAVWAWRDRTRGGERCFEVVVVTRDDGWRPVVTMAPTFGAVGTQVASQAVRATGRTRIRVWSEAAHVHGDIANPATSIRIGWITGALVGPVERYADGRSVPDVQASKWRNALLGLPIRTKREDAKAASLKYMPTRLSGLGGALEAVAQAFDTPTTNLDHVTDSAGVAEYGWKYGGTT